MQDPRIFSTEGWLDTGRVAVMTSWKKYSNHHTKDDHEEKTASSTSFTQTAEFESHRWSFEQYIGSNKERWSEGLGGDIQWIDWEENGIIKL